MAKKHVAIALAVWLTWAAFAGLWANALPNHVVGGGVFGPGDDPSPGPTNPANAAWMVFYSTNQPPATHPLLVGADEYNVTDGTNPAIFAKDVGASWAWQDADLVVAVVETTRGMNGWGDVNYSTSIDGTLAVGPTTQDIGNTALEPFPTLSVVTGADYATLSWAALVDTNGNLHSYEVYTATTVAGPWSGAGSTVLGRVPQGPTPAFNATSLTPGPHCFAVAVNYDRDQVGGVYETTGRSEVECRSFADPAPFIVSTDPFNAEGNVPPTRDITVVFSEAIVPGSLMYALNPPIASLTVNWPSANTAVFSHAATPFTDCLSYQMDITAAQDLGGNSLVGGPVPNPWTFGVICPLPYTITTVPANGATNVQASAPVVITFSEAMNTLSVTVEGKSSANQAVTFAGCTWPTNDECRTSAPFTPGQTYTVWANGTDTTGNAVLHPGPGAPNPWSFAVNVPPDDPLFTAPGINECYTGGSVLTVRWTMNDPDALEESLRVWLNYTDGTTNPTTLQDGTNFPASANYGWTLPPLDESIQLILDVMDSAGDKKTAFSDFFEVDSTAPSATLTSPAVATNVPTNANIIITFSEAMDAAATWSAFSLTPVVSGLDDSWNAGSTVLTVYHNTTSFLVNTAYTVAFAAGAVDDCTPGLALSPTFSETFTTGSGPKAPEKPTNLRTTSLAANSVTIAWNAPSLYTDGTNILPGNLTGYLVFRSATISSTGSQLTPSAIAGTQYTDTTVAGGETYYYFVKAVDTAFGESAFSDALTVVTPEQQPGFDWLLILIPLIVILLIVGLFLLMRRKKPAAAPPKEARAAAPPSGAPAEEEIGAGPAAEEPAPAEESAEGGEKFIPCPNCGTMVKPTDAECFVCGTKL